MERFLDGRKRADNPRSGARRYGGSGCAARATVSFPKIRPVENGKKTYLSTHEKIPIQ
jgi:hypothetical protein